MDDATAQKRAEELLPRAKELLDVLRVGARTAYVVEVTGTPKSGKTSTLAMLEGFFKRAGYRVHVLRERAADCPIPMKGHFFFNAWTTCTMLSEVLATYDTDVDIVLLDRGFFDALVWLGLQQERAQVTAHEARVFTDFVLLERWRKLVDLTLVVTASPPKAMEREGKGALVPKTGSLMNPTALAAFNDQVSKALARHKQEFKIETLDSSESTSAKETALLLLEVLLPNMRAWAEQRILVVPRELVREAFKAPEQTPASPHIQFLQSAKAHTAWEQFQRNMTPRLRHEVERDDSFVQIVGCGIVVHRGAVFLLKRSPKDEKVEYGRAVLWKGCHVQGAKAIELDDVAEQVKARVLEEFHLKAELQTTFLGIAWGGTSETESRHMGLLFLAKLDDESAALSMRDKEFKKAGRGHATVGTFQEPLEIIRQIEALQLEPWSRFAIENIGLQEPV